MAYIAELHNGIRSWWTSSLLKSNQNYMGDKKCVLLISGYQGPKFQEWFQRAALAKLNVHNLHDIALNGFAGLSMLDVYNGLNRD